MAKMTEVFDLRPDGGDLDEARLPGPGTGGVADQRTDADMAADLDDLKEVASRLGRFAERWGPPWDNFAWKAWKQVHNIINLAEESVRYRAKRGTATRPQDPGTFGGS